MRFFNNTLTNYKYSHLCNLQYNMATQINYYSLHYNNSCLPYYYYLINIDYKMHHMN